MAEIVRRTDEVLAAARSEVQAQLALVREELSWLASEELALMEALSSLNGESSTAADDGVSKRPQGPRAAKSRGRATGRTQAPARRRRGASKSTADRVEELRGLLAEGPRSRTDLAAALKVSPARVQQLLAELGSSVSSRPDPKQRRGKLWALSGSGNGAGAESTGKRTGGSKGASPRKPASRRKQAAK